MQRSIALSGNLHETAFVFDCHGEELIGVLHGAQHDTTVGILIVTGGPQYRVGSHRQFVILARDLAEKGVPVMRFDYRGMGDSSGEPVSFDSVDPDLRAAIDAMFERMPALESVVIWGLCDAASAAMIYGWQDARVAGLVLANPWARTDAGEAKALIRHYYWRRFVSTDFWRKLITGKLQVGNTLRSLFGNVKRASGSPTEAGNNTDDSYLDRMEKGMDRFAGPSLLLLSGDDLTAAEFVDYSASSRSWQRILARKTCRQINLPGVNHTFSSAKWRALSADATSNWLFDQFEVFRDITNRSRSHDPESV